MSKREDLAALIERLEESGHMHFFRLVDSEVVDDAIKALQDYADTMGDQITNPLTTHQAVATLIAQLAELEARATPAPWRMGVGPLRSGHGGTLLNVEKDGDLILFLRNEVHCFLPALRDYGSALEAMENFLEHRHHTDACNAIMGWHNLDCDCGHDAALAALRLATAKEVE